MWAGFISSAAALKKNADAIVIDLRSNLGGDDSIGMELVQLLFGHTFEHPISKQYRSQPAETLALAVTKVKVQIIYKKKQNLPVLPYLENELEYTKEQYNLALSGQLLNGTST